MKTRKKTNGYVDLHTHTTCSDGTDTPEELVQLAVKEGIQFLAITDHDEVEGVWRAKQEAEKYHNIQIISGIECSTTFSGGNRHILGYNIRPRSKVIQQYVASHQMLRVEKIHKILEKLKNLGMSISYEEVEKYSVAGSIGRPHIAQAMLEKGYVSTIQEAFELYIGKGKPAYATVKATTPEEVIHVIKAAGGIPVLAHPFQMKLSTQETFKEIERLMAIGLEGVEIIYPEHTNEQNYQLILFAGNHNLYVTVGSDFHGKNKENQMGCCFQNETKVNWNIYSGLGRTIF